MTLIHKLNTIAAQLGMFLGGLLVFLIFMASLGTILHFILVRLLGII